VNISHRTTKSVLFKSEQTTVKESLIEAVARGADLGGANLRGADLRDADLGGADLRDANLGGARVTATQTATLLECLGIVIEEVDEVKP